MAIIRCPKCGGSISDKAKICVHCGYVPAKPVVSVQPRRAFSDLSPLEQDKLREEFRSLNPSYAKYLDYEKSYRRGVQIPLNICYALFFLILPLIIGAVLAIVLPGRVKRKCLRAQKNFDAWLIEEKGLICYSDTENMMDKWKNYFESVVPDYNKSKGGK